MRALIAWIARVASFFLFGRREIVGAEHLGEDRPVVLVANHFNGFVDPLVIAMALRRTPRFVAKASLTKIPGLATLMRAVGVVFVQRRQDGDGTAGNEDAFVECHRALQADDVVCIFPEGTTHDRPHLDPLRTGAARIALGARAAGADRPVVVPVGLTYPDKLAIRSSVLVEFGPPIDLDAAVGPDADQHDHAAVRRLTTDIDNALRAVSPNFADTEDWLTFELAAEVAGPAARDASLHERARTARAIARAPEATRERVRAAIGRYAALLLPLRLTDRDVRAERTTRAIAWSAVRAGAWVVVLGSLVLATAVVNAIPFLLVFAASLRTATPVTKGTVRALVGLVTFPIAWIAWGVIVADGPLPVSGAVALAALGAVGAVAIVQRALDFARNVTTWYATRERVAAVRQVRLVRVQVREAVDEAVAALGRTDDDEHTAPTEAHPTDG